MKNRIFGKYRKDQVIWGYIFIFPTALGLILLNIWPAIQTAILSFQKTVGFGDTEWVGLRNYQKMFADGEVFQSLLNTLIYAVVSIPSIVVLSLLVAVLMNRKVKGLSIYRTIYFLPVVAAPSAVAMIWRWMFNNDYGLINNMLAKIGIDGPAWLTDPSIAIYSIIIVGVWSAIGYNMVLLLAGLQEIPKDYYEAAEIDGASPIQQFFNITLPLVTPTLFFVVVTTVINAFQVFDVIFMMITPNSTAMFKSQSLAYLFYKHSFILNDKGYGSAIVMFLLVIILIITAIQMKLQKKWVNY
ncbi:MULTISPECIES: carbohydrate ABC transporter permease [Enterococcaceae]|uniref:Sugar ABC transporter permease n=2 Tax=Enterococcaceae TaxID=81852 RepID=A0A430ALN0_9ENTE|nr:MULTISPECIES: sugar ABC transporter permease [Enterococcaceae]HPI99822.1 sugar ABC transporter permease [Enterococcus sp.]MDK4439445.1 sugar ABC transporter permease [Enterococcus faecium]MDT2350660.1 sugar ABC transporter permease [Enterococcus faecium]MDT2966273.1 sugar ABC transporter permease [Enterococcus casseliflavus]RHH53140.1 sugar ABC transporter permease [Enterococcus casseliflavus]